MTVSPSLLSLCSGSFLDLSAPPLKFLSLLGDDSKLMDRGLLSGDDVS